MLHSNVTGTPLTVNEVPGPREPQKTMRAPEIQACNPSELWTVTVGSVQALLQLRAQSLCSKTNSSDITFSWAWSGWRWQSDGGRGLGAADEPVLLCFIRRVLSRTNVFRIIWVLRMAGRGGGRGGGGGMKCINRRNGNSPRDQKTLKPCDLNDHQAFSRPGTCWDSQMAKERKRWIDQERLITPPVPDFNKTNPKKRINSPGRPAVFNRE